MLILKLNFDYKKMSTYELSIQSLQLALQWAKDQSYEQMASELRKTKMKLALWRQGIEKPIVDQCYTIKRRIQFRQDWNFGNDHHFTYEGKIFGRQTLYCGKSLEIEHVFNSNERDNSGKDIKFYLSYSELHGIKPVLHDDSDDAMLETYPHITMNKQLLRYGCERSVNLYVKLYTGKLVTIKPVLETSSAEIWNYVSSLTPGLKFELYHNESQLPAKGNVADLKLQGLTLIQVLQPDI